MGMHLCVAGWLDGKKVGYPIRFPSLKCGENKVGIILYKDPDVKTPYDTYCYRVRGTSKTYALKFYVYLYNIHLCVFEQSEKKNVFLFF